MISIKMEHPIWHFLNISRFSRKLRHPMVSSTRIAVSEIAARADVSTSVVFCRHSRGGKTTANKAGLVARVLVAVAS